MSNPPDTTSPLFSSLDALVREGAITGGQADRVYREVSSRTPPTSPAGGTGLGPLDLGRVIVAVAIFAAALTASGFAAISGLAGGRGFEWKTFLPMVVLTLAAAGAAYVSFLASRHDVASRALTGLLLTLAVFGLGLTVVAPWGKDALVYLAAILMIAGGLAGFWWLRLDLITLAAGAGGLVLMIQLMSDTVLGGSDPGPGDVLTAGIAVALYGVAFAVAGWLFSCRTLTVMVGGGLALAAMFVVVVALGTLYRVIYAFSTSAGDSGMSGELPGSAVQNDMRIGMIVGLLVALALAAVYAYTAYPGYAVLSFAGAFALPFVTLELSAGDHPLRWASVVVIVGALIVLAVLARGFLSLGSGRPGGGPRQHESYGPPLGQQPSPPMGAPVPPPGGNAPLPPTGGTAPAPPPPPEVMRW